MKSAISLLSLMFVSMTAWAQNQDIEMADTLRQDGKIYVVVLCIVVILIGLLAYLFKMDKRVKMLEKKYKDKN